MLSAVLFKDRERESWSEYLVLVWAVAWRGPANILIVKFSVSNLSLTLTQPRWASHHYAPVSFPPSSVQQAGPVRGTGEEC